MFFFISHFELNILSELFDKEAKHESSFKLIIGH